MSKNVSSTPNNALESKNLLTEELENTPIRESRGLFAWLHGLFFPKHIRLPRSIYFTEQVQLSNVYPSNTVRNQKFSVFTFFPKLIFEQFGSFTNFYFLMLSLTQLFDYLRIGSWITFFVPLLVVLFFTFLKEGFDDYQRYCRDCEANSSVFSKFTRGGIKHIPCSKIVVGDLILLEKDQRVPADMIILRTTENSGSIYNRTDQLDGETDWKARDAVAFYQHLASNEEVFNYKGVIEAESPHREIYSFNGSISHISPSTNSCEIESLSVDNMLWMNTVVASGSALCCVIYTGSDTKAVLNTSDPPSKLGLTDSELDKMSMFLFSLMVVLSFIMIIFKRDVSNAPLNFFRFIILFSYIIPISLRVSLDLGKFFYSTWISTDAKLPDTVVRTSSIPEELARISYLMSDKTGTLTKNEMEFKKLHLGTIAFGLESIGEITNHLDYYLCSKLQDTVPQATAHTGTSRGKRDISSRVYDIVQGLALTHNVTPTIDTGNIITYQASSPDEVAVVKWTELVGMTLFNRTRELITLKTIRGSYMQFKILYIFPFSSEAKRMSIVVRDMQTNEVIFYQKGADVVMTKIVQKNDWLDEECGNLARDGLRTLVIGRKKISEELLLSFEKEYSRAKISLVDRATAVSNVIAHFFENELELLGITGVEDKLQDGVKISFELLRNAGIKVWMLTGDKVETATCIAVSSRLAAKNQAIYTVEKLQEKHEARACLDTMTNRINSCLIMDGQSISVIMQNYADEFAAITSKASAVVCCRCTPTQKADITRLIQRTTGKRVCAIGDGGNDVSMIQAANLGIGIVGKEGKQASLAADISIPQFSHLVRLLLWHGRYCYKASAKLSQFVIHRGVILTVMQAVYSSLFNFTTLPIFSAAIAIGYSTVYTMAPVFSLIWDRDVTEQIAMRFPELYRDLVKGRSLSFKTMLIWLIFATFQGSAIMLITLSLLDSIPSTLSNIRSITFSVLLINELLVVVMEVTTWHYVMILSEIFSFMVYVLSTQLLTEDFDMSFILSFKFIAIITLATFISFFPIVLYRIYRKCFAPPSYSKLN